MIKYQLPNGSWYLEAGSNARVETTNGVVTISTKSVTLAHEPRSESNGTPQSICISGPSADVDSILNMLKVPDYD